MAFPTTRWSILAHATINGDAAQAEALAEFYRRYREPVVDFIRRQIGDAAHAEDLAQEFFVHLVQHSTLQRADPLRGRFRSFLLGALTRFLARDRTRGGAAKRGGGELPLSLDGLTPGAGEPAVPSAVAAAFDREWARSLLIRVRRHLELEWQGPAAEAAMLLRFLPGAVDTPTYEAAADTLGWPLGRLKTEVFRLRQKFREQVRREVALTVDAPHEIETEMAHLHLVLSDPSI
jgi:RNA polymerase sigma-70 factor (ECF subfamily)